LQPFLIVSTDSHEWDPTKRTGDSLGRFVQDQRLHVDTSFSPGAAGETWNDMLVRFCTATGSAISQLLQAYQAGKI
jgi:hypothetical protein